MWVQFAPAESHCRHWKANVGAGKPVHVPVDAVSRLPREAVPVMAGIVATTGGPVTVAVAFESAVVTPLVLVAVTWSRIVEPASAWTSVYVPAVAPAMSTQLLPPVSHRRHLRVS